MKKLLSALVLFLTAAAASADGFVGVGNLGFNAGYDMDTEYFDKNLNVPFKGKISFRAPNRLIFEGVNMSLQGVQIDADGVEDFTIELHGENRIQAPTTNPIKSNTSLRFEAADDDASLTITGGYSNGYGLVYLTGGGDLVFSGGTYNFSGQSRAVSQHPGDVAAGTLRFENCTVRLKAYGNAASGFRRVQYVGSGLSEPDGVSYSMSRGYYLDATDEPVTEVRIEPAYDLWVAGVQLTKANLDNFAALLISKGLLEAAEEGPVAVEYIPEARLLSLTNARLNSPNEAIGLRSEVSDLTIELSGLNVVYAPYAESAIELGKATRITGEDLAVYGDYGIQLGGDLTVGMGAGVELICQSVGISGAWRQSASGVSFYTTALHLAPESRFYARGKNGAVRNLRDFTLGEGLAILLPEGGYIAGNSHEVFDASGELATTVLILPSETPAYDRYDLNRDGQVDVSDVTVLVSAILGGAIPPTSFDLNQDGSIDVSDVTVLVGEVLARN